MSPPRFNDRYELQRQLGAGAEGDVWLVEDRQSGRRLAAKRVRGIDPDARARLAGEFRRLAALRHPNLVRVYDLETGDDGAPFFTADFVEGVPPSRHVATGDEPPEKRLLSIATDIASALTHIHAAGLRHGDVKPDNIVVRAGDGAAVLLDLGLSAAREIGGVAPVAGSFAYLSREALAGRADARADLYALGATLYEIATGRPPFAGDTPAELVRAICEDPLISPAALTPWLPQPMAALIEKLLARDPASRHSSARALLDDLARLRERFGIEVEDRERPDPPALLPPSLVGRDEALAALAAALRSVAEPPTDPPAPQLIRIVGPPGIGRRALLDEAIRRHQLAVAAGRARPLRYRRAAVDTLVDEVRALAANADDGEGVALARWVDAFLAGLKARATAEPTAIAFDDAGDPRAAAIADAIEAGATPLDGARICVLVVLDGEPDEPPTGGARAATVALSPLSAGDTARLADSMVGRTLDRTWTDALAAASGGVPALAVEIVRAAAAEHGPDDVERADPRALLEASGDQALAGLIVRRVAALPPDGAAVLEGLAILGGRATAGALADLLDCDAEDICATAAHLAGRGFLKLAADQLRLPSDAHTRAIAAALPTARARALHRRALEQLARSRISDPVRRARHQIVAGPASTAAATCLDAAAELERRGRIAAAVVMTREAVARSTGAPLGAANLELARRATAVGRYDEAIEAARQAARSRDPDRRRRGALLLARAQQKLGELQAAERTLAKLVDTSRGDEEAIGAYARVLVSRAHYDRAAEIVGDPTSEAPRTGALPTGRALRLEAAGLARLYTNDLNGADAAFARLEDGARAAGDRGLRGRALALRGMVAQTRGDIPLAADLYATAHTEARAASDVHAAAVYALNRATALSVRGRHGDAVRAIDDAIAQLRRLGAVAELAGAQYNRGVSLLALGELAAARRAAERALAEAEAHGAPEMQIFALLLDGDVARREGALQRALSVYQRAVDKAIERGQPRALLLARVNLAEAMAELGDRRAGEVLAEAASDARADDDRDQIAVARARVALAGCGDPDAAAEQLETTRRRLRDAGRIDLAWRADALAARLLHGRGDRSGAARALAAARAAFQELLAAAPESHRDGMRTDPDAVSLTAAGAEIGGAELPALATESQPVPNQEARLRRLLALSRRLNSELRLGPLLDDVIDTLIELTAAERGFLLLMRDGALDVEVARNFDQSALAGDELQVSRSIAERAARSGEVVLTLDAAFDERFGAAASVAALRLRSVLAVPLRQKGRVTGTIYLDHRFRRGAFTDDAVELVLELADIAAVAIENARLVAENQRRQAEIAELNRRLEDEVVRKEAELATVKARLDARGETELRHPYEAIVGRSQPMLDMLSVVDRATETSLPVVIFGESGTGKELVARALHANGPRRDKPFVAINCGAVPAELLESELFGHVRGAFTGAERDRRGLFEVANEGTLFLDEVADTSQAMQAKLLRVLQEGEIRRVGDERPRRVDVRVVAASNRQLRALVDDGAFREDLFYRLHVLQIRVPTLRERIEDIPALAAALLERANRNRQGTQTIDRAAMARLCAYPWPGNVRELENELARAAALAGDVIGVADLSPAVAAADAARPPLAPDDLRLRPRVEALERALVEDAMARANGNQTAAARLLGLSRYGLQKKLKRYGIAGSSIRNAS